MPVNAIGQQPVRETQITGETEYAGIVERGAYKIRNAAITEIIKESRINEISGKDGLNDTAIAELESARNIAL